MRIRGIQLSPVQDLLYALMCVALVVAEHGLRVILPSLSLVIFLAVLSIFLAGFLTRFQSQLHSQLHGQVEFSAKEQRDLRSVRTDIYLWMGE